MKRETATLIQLRGIANWNGASVNLALGHEYYDRGQQIRRVAAAPTLLSAINLPLCTQTRDIVPQSAIPYRAAIPLGV